MDTTAIVHSPSLLREPTAKHAAGSCAVFPSRCPQHPRQLRLRATTTVPPGAAPSAAAPLSARWARVAGPTTSQAMSRTAAQQRAVRTRCALANWPTQFRASRSRRTSTTNTKMLSHARPSRRLYPARRAEA